ncbi:MAG: OadG family protein [Sulfuricurvum sp.]|uniref:OadG family protein n=1 Tax=Sulfuricurvum sp. IAE1 TaxID=2546102 RepID=UPI00210371E8|nr:OadG family protein [Sulfuricurvum sp. IAE1]MDD3769775.1 OadG family protein [Sulfuricurvum sp.]MDX9966291.1 OadG family protein [Sulfuricurvum sp.]
MFFESVKIMLLGMGTVFLFLIIMNYMTVLMSKMINKYFPEAPKAPEPTPRAQAKRSDDKAKVAAIAAAIHHHQITQN